ncbi:HGGxSTG domain-containing protein [Oceanobacillus sp. CFH 90083]|uniref:HGGxSTG domain-containing protein n=1 Tax=Oceanobacillus sp. CFH 90083 TaxID=2592336 RepID=UPI00128B2583|nr:HGGxSTG domain-containing protein [Oceanobacillus sp. CFH 90083]
MQNKPHANNFCGAKTRSGKSCKNKAMPNGRCRMHGGKSTGAPPKKMKKNKNANKHGLFAKYLPEETLQIMNEATTLDSKEILWMNIQMLNASIIRAQMIMDVKNQKDTTKTLSRVRKGESTNEKEWEVQHAWDKHSTFMVSLSRSMAELRNMIKQYADMTDEDDIRLLEIDKIKATIAKTKAETEKINKDDKAGAPPVINIIEPSWSKDYE